MLSKHPEFALDNLDNPIDLILEVWEIVSWVIQLDINFDKVRTCHLFIRGLKEHSFHNQGQQISSTEDRVSI